MKNTIRKKFIIVYSLLITIIIISVSLVYNDSVKRVFDSQVAESLARETELHTIIISEKLEYHKDRIHYLANALSKTDLSKINIEEFLIDNTSSRTYFFDSIYFVDQNGFAHTSFSAPQNISEHPFFKEQLDCSQSTCISDIILDPFTQENVFNIITPVKYNNETIGILVGSIPISTFISEIDKFKLPYDGYSWIIDEDGYFISHPQYDYTDEKNINDLLLEGSDDFTIPSEVLLDLHYGFGAFKETNNEPSYFFTFSTINSSPNWRLGINFEREYVFSIDFILYAIIIPITVCALIISIFLTSFLTSKILAPIRNLTKAVVNNDIYDEKLDFIQKNIEITQLISAYNQQRKELSEHSERLEQLVDERTQKLNIANQKLKELASKDELTGIYNRTYFNNSIIDYINKVHTNELSSFAILFLDLDNFKYYNDTFGHDIGDQILVCIAKYLTSYVDPQDTVIRYGGDEFIVIMENIQENNIHSIITRINNSFKKLNGFQNNLSQWLNQEFVNIPDDKKLDISIGYAIYDHSTKITAEDLVKMADEKMYLIKKEKK